MRVRKREACSESCGNNLITLTLTHHARSKRSEINSTLPESVADVLRPVTSNASLYIGKHHGVSYSCLLCRKSHWRRAIWLQRIVNEHQNPPTAWEGIRFRWRTVARLHLSRDSRAITRPPANNLLWPSPFAGGCYKTTARWETMPYVQRA